MLQAYRDLSFPKSPDDVETALAEGVSEEEFSRISACVFEQSLANSPVELRARIASIAAVFAGSNVVYDGYDKDDRSDLCGIWFESVFDTSTDDGYRVEIWGSFVRYGELPPYLKLDWVFVRPNGHGITMRFLDGLALHQLLARGFSKIELFAAGGPGEPMNGYYTWVAFGFKIDFDETLRDLAAKAGFLAQSTHDLILKYGRAGLLWWKHNGRASEAVLDLTPGSDHLLILEAYLERKRGNLS